MPDRLGASTVRVHAPTHRNRARHQDVEETMCRNDVMFMSAPAPFDLIPNCPIPDCPIPTLERTVAQWPQTDEVNPGSVTRPSRGWRDCNRRYGFCYQPQG
jgi:hypothetical protein